MSNSWISIFKVVSLLPLLFRLICYPKETFQKSVQKRRGVAHQHSDLRPRRHSSSPLCPPQRMDLQSRWRHIRGNYWIHQRNCLTLFFYSTQVPQRRTFMCPGVDSAQPELMFQLIRGPVSISYQFLACLTGNVTASLLVCPLYSYLPAY